MVVTRLPATSLIGVTQLRIALPSTCTVQAPHRPIPQPNFAPVSSRRSRRYHRTGIAGSPSNCLTDPFTVSLIMFVSSLRVWVGSTQRTGLGAQPTLYYSPMLTAHAGREDAKSD